MCESGLRHQKYINRRQSTSFFMSKIRVTQGFTRFFPSTEVNLTQPTGLII